jgi:hypothetical protein
MHGECWVVETAGGREGRAGLLSLHARPCAPSPRAGLQAAPESAAAGRQGLLLRAEEAQSLVAVAHHQAGVRMARAPLAPQREEGLPAC